MKLLVNENNQLNLQGILKLSLIVSFFVAIFLQGSITLNNTITINIIPLLIIVYSLVASLTLFEEAIELILYIKKTLQDIIYSVIDTLLLPLKKIKEYLSYSFESNVSKIYQRNNVIRC